MQERENSQDASLVLAVRAGDNAAYGQLIERHGARIHALCFRLCGRAGVAPELAHDSFVEASRRCSPPGCVGLRSMYAACGCGDGRAS
jgi:hypothetical protein